MEICEAARSGDGTPSMVAIKVTSSDTANETKEEEAADKTIKPEEASPAEMAKIKLIAEMANKKWIVEVGSARNANDATVEITKCAAGEYRNEFHDMTVLNPERQFAFDQVFGSCDRSTCYCQQGGPWALYYQPGGLLYLGGWWLTETAHPNYSGASMWAQGEQDCVPEDGWQWRGRIGLNYYDVSFVKVSEIDQVDDTPPETENPEQVDDGSEECLRELQRLRELNDVKDQQLRELQQLQAAASARAAEHEEALWHARETHTGEKQELELTLQDACNAHREAMALVEKHGQEHMETEKQKQEFERALQEAEAEFQERLAATELQARRLLEEQAASGSEAAQVNEQLRVALEESEQSRHDLLDEVAHLQEEVQRLKAQLNEEEETSCPKCNDVYIADALFCRKCGHKRRLSEHQAQMLAASHPKVPQTVPSLRKYSGSVRTSPATSLVARPSGVPYPIPSAGHLPGQVVTTTTLPGQGSYRLPASAPQMTVPPQQ